MGLRLLQSCAMAVSLLACAGGTAAQSESKAVASAPVQNTADGIAPYPAPRSIYKVAVIDDRTIRYTVTVGAIPVTNDAGTITGEVVYTAYIVRGPAANRPVTFALNGGPGSASAYLNLGTMGPQTVAFGQPGNLPSSPVIPKDNPNSWLDFTDLVFIDPIGTGFSRTHLDRGPSDQEFFEADADIRYLSRAIHDWLVKAGRMQSRKYLVGESYGGYRVPRMALHLQTELGIGLSGITMVSPYLDPPSLADNDSLSPLPWLITLPSLAAASLEHDGIEPDDERMLPVETYARTEFVQDFLAGTLDSAATDRMVTRVAAMTGLEIPVVRRMAGRVDANSYLRELHRTEGKLGSINEPSVTMEDPFPAALAQEPLDPGRARNPVPLTEAMMELVTRQIGWDVGNARYRVRAPEVNRRWKYDDRDSAVLDLRKAMAIDPAMTVNLVHGWSDLNCPYFGSKLIIRQMPTMEMANRVRLRIYPGGHMFYTRPDSGAAFRRDIKTSYNGN